MSTAATTEQFSATGQTWQAANLAYLDAELSRLRLLLQLRVLWLRRVWKRDLAQEFSNFSGHVITDADADHALQPVSADEESRFYEHDESALSIMRLLREQQTRIQEAAQTAVTCGGPPALDILGRLFRLEEFEQDVLLMALAPSVDSSFERLYGYVQDDATQKYPTIGLAMQVLGKQHGGTAQAWRYWLHFAPDAPLQRFRLLHTDTTSPSNLAGQPLRITRRVADYLLGVNHLDEQLNFVARRVANQGALGREQEETVDVLERRLQSWNDRGHMPAVQLTGEANAGHRAVACELCERVGISLYTIDPASLLAMAADRQAYFRVLERESLLLPCAYYLDCMECDPANRVEMVRVLEFLNQVQAFTVIAAREPVQSERRLITTHLAGSEAATQVSVWKADLAAHITGQHSQDQNSSADAMLARLVQQFRFSPQQIHRVVQEACETAGLRNPEAPTLESRDLWLTARAQASRSMDGLAERIVARRSFSELVLPSEQLQQIQELASQVEQRGRVYEQWGFGAKLNRGKGIAALFAGPSGTGKTMAAEVLAHHLDLDLYRIDLASVISKYIGETEKNLRRLFEAAEAGGAILFFDEADALFGKRSEVRDSHDRYANIEINYLLQRMEDYRGLAILATNRKSLLDQAFLRRLRFLVDFPFPSAADRSRIWQGAFPAEAEVETLDYAALGKLEISGGNISNIALNAAFLAAAQGVHINMDHLLTAARREYVKIDKLITEGELGRSLPSGK